MSVTTDATPNVAATDTDFSSWSFDDAISDLAHELGLPNATAAAPDDPPADVADQPTSDEGLAKPGDDAKAEAEEQHEDDDSSGEDDGTERVIPRIKAEEMRATAQRERDQARNEVDKLRAELDAANKQRAEDTFYKGVLFRANQLLENNPNLSVNQANKQAWDEMSALRNAEATQQQRLEVEADTTRRVNDSVSLAAAQASENLYLLNVNAVQREVTKMGVPTFDAETAIRDVMMQERWERRVDQINAIPNADLQKQAAQDFYDDVKGVVLAKAAKLAEAAKSRKPAITARQQAQNAPPTVSTPSTPSEFANLDIQTLIEQTFAPDNYRQELEAHPKLTIKR